MADESTVTLKECEHKRDCIRKEKHSLANSMTESLAISDSKIGTLEDRITDNEKKNLKNHITLKNSGDNTQKEVDGIIEENKSFKKILRGGGVYIILTLLGVLGVLLTYIYQLITKHG